MSSATSEPQRFSHNQQQSLGCLSLGPRPLSICVKAGWDESFHASVWLAHSQGPSRVHQGVILKFSCHYLEKSTRTSINNPHHLHANLSHLRFSLAMRSKPSALKQRYLLQGGGIKDVRWVRCAREAYSAGLKVFCESSQNVTSFEGKQRDRSLKALSGPAMPTSDLSSERWPMTGNPYSR